MPQGRRNNRGFRPGPPRGRGGRGRGRGGHKDSGRGPGFINADELYRGDGTLVFEGSFQDFTLDIVEPGTQRSKFSKRGWRREGYQTPKELPHPSEFRQRVAPQKGIRGIGYPKSSFGPRNPLSILRGERPLLQPINFVRGEHVKTLFEEVEEILHAPGEAEKSIEGKVLSNDIVEKIFHHELSVQNTCASDSDSEEEAGEELEERILIDHTLLDDSTDDLEAIEEAVDSSPTRYLIESRGKTTQDTDISTENIDYSETAVNSKDTNKIEDENFPKVPTESLENLSPREEQPEVFVIDPSPSPVVFGPGQIVIESLASETVPLGQVPVEEEVIVYEAPNPRSNREVTPHPLVPIHPPTFDTLSLSLTSKCDSQESSVVQTRESLGLRSTPRSRKLANKERAGARHKQRRMSMFTMGLSHEDHTLLESRFTVKSDPRKAQRRLGDSDIDWGSENEEDASIEEVRSGIVDMDLDPDVGDITVLSQFVDRVQGFTGDTFVTIDDLNDIQRMRDEDEDIDGGGGFKDESDKVFNAPERKEIGEVDVTDSSDSSNEESDQDTPRAGFEARLNRLRKRAKGKIPVHDESSSDDDQNWGPRGKGLTWADKDESYLNHIEELLDKTDETLLGDRKARKKVFKAIEQGHFDDEDISFNLTKKNRHIPSHLQEQWERDRQKKAQRKRERELTRLEEAISASPLGKGKLEKQKRKLLTRGGLSPRGDTLYTGDIDTLKMLESVMREFLNSLELKNMVMPPKDKEFRRHAHSLADAFNVKSKSQGKDSHRFTTFIKTSKSGININEHRIASIIRSQIQRTPGQSITRLPFIRHKDGEIVGKTAPRLNDSNIGFKLLQQMGWNEGERIGVTGGLADPLTAVIKTTKLGLGATR